MQDGHEYCEPGRPMCQGCKAAAYDRLVGGYSVEQLHKEIREALGRQSDGRYADAVKTAALVDVLYGAVVRLHDEVGQLRARR